MGRRMAGRQSVVLSLRLRHRRRKIESRTCSIEFPAARGGVGILQSVMIIAGTIAAGNDVHAALRAARALLAEKCGTIACGGDWPLTGECKPATFVVRTPASQGGAHPSWIIARSDARGVSGEELARIARGLEELKGRLEVLRSAGVQGAGPPRRRRGVRQGHRLGLRYDTDFAPADWHF